MLNSFIGAMHLWEGHSLPCSPFGLLNAVFLRFAPGLSKNLPVPSADPAILSKSFQQPEKAQGGMIQ
jgi:hypothetical protein